MLLRTVIAAISCLSLVLAWDQADVSDPTVIAAAVDSVRLYEDESQSVHAYTLEKLLRALYQVESNGTRYRFDESIGITNCTREEMDSGSVSCVTDWTMLCSLVTFESNTPLQNIKNGKSGKSGELENGACTRSAKPVKVAKVSHTGADGSWQDVNVDNPQVQTSAIRALSMYEVNTLSQYALRMELLISAKMQVVAGLRYNFIEDVGNTNCSRQQEDANPNNCAVIAHQICNFTTFEQSWTDTYVLESSTCVPNQSTLARPVPVSIDHVPLSPVPISQTPNPDSSPDHKNAEAVKMIPTLPPIDGGWQPVNTSSPEIQVSAQRALMLYETDSKSVVALRMLHLLHAEAQIVSGIQYKFLEHVGVTNCTREQEDATPANCAIISTELCQFETLEQPWIDTYILESSNCLPSLQVKQATVVNPPDGGWQDLNVSSPQVQASAQRALRQYETDSNSSVALRMLHLIKAEMQIVAGVRYKFVEHIGLTNCSRQQEDENSANCAVASTQFCNFTTFEQSWTDTYILEDSNCVPESLILMVPTTPPHEDGGWQEVNVNNPQVQTSAIRAVDLYEEQINSQYALRMITLYHAEMQVVAGVRYKFFESVGVTNCSRAEEDANNLNCIVKTRQLCNFTTFEQAWTNTYELQSSFCVLETVSPPPNQQQAEATPKLPAYGSWQNADTDSVEIKKMAVTALRLHQITASPMLALKVVSILSAGKQVTAGMNYYLKVIVGTTDCASSVDTSILNNCKVTKTQICELTLFSLPWIQSDRLTSSRCLPATTEYITIPSSGPQAMEAATAGIAEIDAQNSGLVLSLTTVHEAMAQYTVPPSGISNYKLDVDVSYSSAQKNEVARVKMVVEKLMVIIVEGVPQKTYLLVSCESANKSFTDQVGCTFVPPVSSH